MTGKEFNSATIRDKGEGQRAGLAGECAFQWWCNEAWLWSHYIDNYDYDFNIGKYAARYRVDVKTMDRNVDPTPEYTCKVEERQKDYRCQIYVFCSFNKKTSVVFVMGWLPKLHFWNTCRIIKEGEDMDGKVCPRTCGILEHSKLRHMNELSTGIMNEERHNGAPLNADTE